MTNHLRVRNITKMGPMRQLIWMIFCAVMGCASQPAAIVGSQGYRIEDVSFEGATRFSKSHIMKVLYANEHSWIPLSADATFDDALIIADAQRIVDLYRAYGYYEARVTDVQTRQEKDRIFVNFVIDEGEPVTVQNINIRWQPSVDEVTTAEVLKAVTVEVGQPFEVGRYNETLGALRQSLQIAGYPLAETTGKVQVSLANRAVDLEINVVPGEVARIGDVRIEGLVHVPEHLVLVEVEFAQGQPFSPARIAQMEASVRGTRVFSWVSARVETRVEDGLIDVVMQVSEADPHTLRIGAEISIDTVRWQEQARLDYTHTNLFGNLTRLDMAVLAGWAELPNPWNTDLHGPVASLSPKFTKKGLLEKHLLWSINPKIAVDLEEGYQYLKVSDRMGVSRWFEGTYLLGLNHIADYVDFFNLSPQLDQSKVLLGRDFRDPYLLSMVELSAAAFFVDHITSPTNGVIAETSYALASEFVLSNFDYHKALLTLRGYWKPFARLQLASRVRGGVIVPYGENGSVPFNQRYYLGGATSVRGWGSRRLSPRIEECSAEGDCKTIPVGGYSLVQGNFEARVQLIKQLALVGFVDVGDVQADTTFDPALWNYSAGPGLRAETPFGVVRLDAGFRLNDPGVYTGEPTWGIYFGLGQAL